MALVTPSFLPVPGPLRGQAGRVAHPSGLLPGHCPRLLSLPPRQEDPGNVNATLLASFHSARPNTPTNALCWPSEPQTQTPTPFRWWGGRDLGNRNGADSMEEDCAFQKLRNRGPLSSAFYTLQMPDPRDDQVPLQLCSLGNRSACHRDVSGVVRTTHSGVFSFEVPTPCEVPRWRRRTAHPTRSAGC